MQLQFGVTSIQGTSAQVRVQRLIDWAEPHYLVASLAIQDDLSTKLEILIDGSVAARAVLQQPLVVDARFIHDEKFLNRAADGDTQKFSFALSEQAVYTAVMQPLERARLIGYFEEGRTNLDRTCVLFTADSYGHIPVGERDMKMHGEVRTTTLKDLLRSSSDDNPSPDRSADELCD